LVVSLVVEKPLPDEVSKRLMPKMEKDRSTVTLAPEVKEFVTEVVEPMELPFAYVTELCPGHRKAVEVVQPGGA
jgi:hypothetical protein